MEKLRVKKILFKTTTTPDGQTTVEPVPANKFYGKAVCSLRVYSKEKNCTQDPHKAAPKQCYVRTPKSKQLDGTCKGKPSKCTSDDTSNGFIDEFVAAICGDK